MGQPNNISTVCRQGLDEHVDKGDTIHSVLLKLLPYLKTSFLQRSRDLGCIPHDDSHLHQCSMHMAWGVASRHSMLLLQAMCYTHLHSTSRPAVCNKQ